MTKGAIFSGCGNYRYVLIRQWDAKPLVCFIGLNPSTADHEKDDPTTQACIRIAQAQGHGGLALVNLFSFRATNPADMLSASYPIGADNDYWINIARGMSIVTIAAWGRMGRHLDRDRWYRNLQCMGYNKDGTPVHPLYQKRNVELIDYVYQKGKPI